MALLHVVSLRFRDDLTDADVRAHMLRDVNLQVRYLQRPARRRLTTTATPRPSRTLYSSRSLRPQATARLHHYHSPPSSPSQARMPHLVSCWTFRKNETLRERADANGGCNWVVISKLFRAEDLPTYIAHPEHQAVAAIQRDLITNKHVVDMIVGADEFSMRIEHA